MSEPKNRAGHQARISVRNLQRSVRVDVAALTSFAQRAVQACAAVPAPQSLPAAELAVLLVSDRRISSLHRQFMNVSGPTDVITFQHGEIFISVPTARRHARRFGNPLIRELQLYVVHGLLHLRGFQDERPADARRMQALQEKILQRLAVAS